jgi:hypothetical protein
MRGAWILVFLLASCGVRDTDTYSSGKGNPENFDGRPLMPPMDPVETRLLTNDEIALIEGAVKRSLRDPASAVFKHPEYFQGENVYCVRVNARNGYGGYTGFQQISLLVRSSGGRIISAASFDGGHGQRVVDLYCEEKGYP